MKLQSGVGLTIGIPTLGRPVVMEWAMAWKALNAPINYNQRVSTILGQPVAEARNEIAEQAVKEGSKYLFFLGDDVEVPPHTLKQLIFRLEHHQDIGVVGGIYCSKSDPPNPLVFRGNGRGCYWDWKIGEFFEVTGLGMDCTLIRVEMLQQMAKPWFYTKDEDQYLDAINHIEQWTEDLWFLRKVTEETDYKIFADGMVICRHWNPYERKFYTLPPDSKPMQAQERGKQKKKIVDLGCGPTYVELPEGKAIRVDAREEVDPDYRCDLRCLPFESDEFDIAFSSHTLEHFKREEVPAVLKEWVRILKPGGELRLIVPNLEWAADKIKEGVITDPRAAYRSAPPEETMERVSWDAFNVLYGQQEYELNFHKVGFTPVLLKRLLEAQKLKIVKEQVEGYNIILHGRKSESSTPPRKDAHIDQKKQRSRAAKKIKK